MFQYFRHFGNRELIGVVFLALFGLYLIFFESHYELTCNGKICIIEESSGKLNLNKHIIEQFNQKDVKSNEITYNTHKHSKHGTRHNEYKLSIILENGRIINTHITECHEDYQLKSIAEEIEQLRPTHIKQ